MIDERASEMNIVDEDASIQINNFEDHGDVENSPNVKTCGKSDKKDNYECPDGRKHCCEDCPTATVRDHCLECLMIVESYPVTSTPTKRNL